MNILSSNLLEVIRLLKIKKKLSSEYRNLLEESLLLQPELITREEASEGLFSWILSHAWKDSGTYPQLSFSARKYLQICCESASSVFVYGAGKIATFVSSRVKDTFIVDDLEKNVESVRSHAYYRFNRNKTKIRLIRPQVADGESLSLDSWDPLAYRSHDEIDTSLCFRDYAKSIEDHPDNSFDLIILAGRARSACFVHAVAKIKMGGYIVVDDIYSPANRCILDMAEELGFTVRKYVGVVPGQLELSVTAFFRRVKKSYALNNLDLKLEKYLNFEEGFFIEAGGNNGVKQSNTLYFEALRKWRGMLIEPIPSLAHECRTYRPHAIVEQVALVSPEAVPGEITVHFAGLMSVVKGGMASEEERAEHIKVGCEIQALKTYEVQVPTATLSDILDKHNVSKVDFLSLDVEGFELQVLSGLDFSRHAPTYILVEERYSGISEYLFKNNYEVVEKLTHHDYLYRIRNHQVMRSQEKK